MSSWQLRLQHSRATVSNTQPFVISPSHLFNYCFNQNNQTFVTRTLLLSMSFENGKTYLHSNCNTRHSLLHLSLHLSFRGDTPKRPAKDPFHPDNNVLAVWHLTHLNWHDIYVLYTCICSVKLNDCTRATHNGPQLTSTSSHHSV
jgi:hypothetical protein